MVRYTIRVVLCSWLCNLLLYILFYSFIIICSSPHCICTFFHSSIIRVTSNVHVFRYFFVKYEVLWVDIAWHLICKSLVNKQNKSNYLKKYQTTFWIRISEKRLMSPWFRFLCTNSQITFDQVNISSPGPGPTKYRSIKYPWSKICKRTASVQ